MRCARQCARRSHAPATCLMMEKWEAVGGIYPDMDSSKANEVRRGGRDL